MRPIFIVIVEYPDRGSEIIGGWTTKEKAKRQIDAAHPENQKFMSIIEIDPEE